MTFWSSQTLRAAIPASQIVLPYDASRIIHSAYELGVGHEAFVTSNPSDKTQLQAGAKVVIPPGQFGLIVTHETIHIPADAIGFISIRASIKFQGLINVSGFHVDPGYSGQLKFSVYNAGSRSIILDQEQRVFMMWLASLDHTDCDPYPNRQRGRAVISADDVSRMHGDVASPAELKKELDELRLDLDKKFHATEQTRLTNRTLIMTLLGVVITILITLVTSYLRK